jgi:hypothetical protein
MNNDDGSGQDLPIIDVRSPSERLADSGRDGVARLQERLRNSPLDVAALVWMICVIGFLAVQIYSAFSSPFDDFTDSDGWFKAALLASSGGFALTAGCMIGISLAAWRDTRPARVALVAAVIGGAWAIVASLIGVAVIFHEDTLGIGSLLSSNFADNRAVSAFGQLMLGGLGVVVVFVAASLLVSRRATPSRETGIADLD